MTRSQALTLRILLALLFVLIGLTIHRLTASESQTTTVRFHGTVRLAE